MSGLAKKLLIHKAERKLVLHPPEGYLDAIKAEGAGPVELDEPEGRYDWIHLFVRSSKELAEYMPQVLDALTPDGYLWVSYPKKSSGVDSDLSRDILWELMKSYGRRPVTQVSIDQTWSALRFRPL